MFSLLFVFLSWGSVSEETTSYLILSYDDISATKNGISTKNFKLI